MKKKQKILYACLFGHVLPLKNNFKHKMRPFKKKICIEYSFYGNGNILKAFTYLQQANNKREFKKKIDKMWSTKTLF